MAYLRSGALKVIPVAAGAYYDTGVWTPDFRGSGGSAGSSSTTVGGSGGAHYTRVGDMVFWSCQITWANKGSWSGSVHIHGLPFTSGDSTYYPGAVGYLGGTGAMDFTGSGTFISPRADPNQTYLTPISHKTGGASTDVTVADVAAGHYAIIAGWYRTNAAPVSN